MVSNKSKPLSSKNLFALCKLGRSILLYLSLSATDVIILNTLFSGYSIVIILFCIKKGIPV